MIKTIIFDFDNTMYVGDVGGDYSEYEKRVLLKFLTPEKYDELVEKYSINKTNSLMHTLHICKQEGFNAKKMFKRFDKEIYQHQHSKISIIADEVLKGLSEKCNLYVVSMSTPSYLKYYFSKYQINAKLFKDIVSVTDIDDVDKTEAYKKILKKEKLLPEEALMVGDNFNIDILSAQKLGMNALLFQGDFNQMYNYFTEHGILDCTPYKNKCRTLFS